MSIIDKINAALKKKGLTYFSLARMFGKEPKNMKRQIKQRIDRLNETIKPADIELTVKQIKIKNET